MAEIVLRRVGVGLLRLPSTKTGGRERVVPLPTWAVELLRQRRDHPDSLGGWRDPSNVRRVWRGVRDELEMEGLVSHTLRKTVASFADDASVSMTQDRYLGRRLTDRETADVLKGMLDGENGPKAVPEPDNHDGSEDREGPCLLGWCAVRDSNPEPAD